MALLATLKLKDVPQDYKVADFRLHMARNYNHFNPESAPSCERIEMTVVAPVTDDYVFYEWYKDHSMLSGKLSYELPVTMNHTYPESRVIEFRDAQCFSFTENYDINSENRRLLTLQIVPGQVKLDNVRFEKL